MLSSTQPTCAAGIFAASWMAPKKTSVEIRRANYPVQGDDGLISDGVWFFTFHIYLSHSYKRVV
jgi:hypothetical protein